MRRINVNDLPERYKRQIAIQSYVSRPVTDLEPPIKPAPLATKEGKGYDGPVVIVVLERRHRLPDRDGSSFKYLLDAIVSAGLLQDDNRKIVQDIKRIEVQVSKDEPEETIVEIYDANIHS